jgi:hypothetical protein
MSRSLNSHKDSEREAERAREALMREAEKEGADLKPFSINEDWSGGPDVANDPTVDVDSFLRMLREWRSVEGKV